ncbi:MAG: hypothetical protein WC378_04160 [Opitutaceae bacterium]|jgi:hypothetical protein
MSLAGKAVLITCLIGGAAFLVRAEVALDSPFLPVSGSQASAQEGVLLEFRGIMAMNGEEFFNLVDPSTKKGAWLKLNQTGRPFVVRGHEVSGPADNVIVEYQGRTLKLALLRPKTAKASPVASVAAAAAAAAPRGPISPVVLNPTPADEAVRLEAFRAEVLRRRLQRQQAAQQGAAAPAPQAK